MNLAFRVDAGPRVGVGHLMRCIALAEAFGPLARRKSFLSIDVPQSLNAQVEAVGGELVPMPGVSAIGMGEDIENTQRIVAELDCDMLIVDHYGVSEEWESQLRALTGCMLVIDDLGRPHNCDVLVDQNLRLPGVELRGSALSRDCLPLLGPNYALLRREFAEARPNAVVRKGQVKRVLISFGGSDARNHTESMVNAFATIGTPKLSVTVLLGSLHPSRESVKRRCAGLGFEVIEQPSQVAKQMLDADLGIGAGGITLWERCALGLPSIALCAAENQREQLHAAENAGLVMLIDEHASEAETAASIRKICDDATGRERMSTAGLAAVDGLGASRVVDAARRTLITVRRAAASDAALVFEWRNHESIRAVSRDPDLLKWNEHLAWFTAAITRPNCLLLIGEVDAVPVGVVRFDIGAHDAEVSIFLNPDRKAPARGTRLLRAAERTLRELYPSVLVVRAVVMRHNVRSRDFFQRSGYHDNGAAFEKDLRS